MASSPEAPETLALRALYAGPLMAHARHPARRGRLPTPTHAATDVNRPCGDRLTLTLEVAPGDAAEPVNDVHIRAIRFEGEGCALAMAAASIVCDHLEGQPVAAIALLEAQLAQALDPASEAALAPDLAPLAAARAFPSRHACVRLPVHVVVQALQTLQKPVR